MDSKVPWGKGYVSSQEGNIYTGWWSVSNMFYFHPWGRFIFQMGWNHQLLRMQCFGWSTWERRRPNGEPWAVEICGKKHVPFNTPLDLYRFLFHTSHIPQILYIYGIYVFILALIKPTLGPISHFQGWLPKDQNPWHGNQRCDCHTHSLDAPTQCYWGSKKPRSCQVQLQPMDKYHFPVDQLMFIQFRFGIVLEYKASTHLDPFCC